VEPAGATGIGCCPRAASGHTAAAPPGSVMTSRRLTVGTSGASNEKIAQRRLLHYEISGRSMSQLGQTLGLSGDCTDVRLTAMTLHACAQLTF
jgi:hypothetical protein